MKVTLSFLTIASLWSQHASWTRILKTFTESALLLSWVSFDGMLLEIRVSHTMTASWKGIKYAPGIDRKMKVSIQNDSHTFKSPSGPTKFLFLIHLLVNIAVTCVSGDERLIIAQITWRRRGSDSRNNQAEETWRSVKNDVAAKVQSWWGLLSRFLDESQDPLEEETLRWSYSPDVTWNLSRLNSLDGNSFTCFVSLDSRVDKLLFFFDFEAWRSRR